MPDLVLWDERDLLALVNLASLSRRRHIGRQPLIVPLGQSHYQALRLAAPGQTLAVCWRRDDLPVFFDKPADVGVRQDVEHCLGWTTELDPLWRDDNRTVDQDRVRHHEVEQLVVGPFRIAEPEFRVGCSLLAQEGANRNPHRGDQFLQALACRRASSNTR